MDVWIFQSLLVLDILLIYINLYSFQFLPHFQGVPLPREIPKCLKPENPKKDNSSSDNKKAEQKGSNNNSKESDQKSGKQDNKDSVNKNDVNLAQNDEKDKTSLPEEKNK